MASNLTSIYMVHVLVHRSNIFGMKQKLCMAAAPHAEEENVKVRIGSWPQGYLLIFWTILS
jgi:hypothetical protein